MILLFGSITFPCILVNIIDSIFMSFTCFVHDKTVNHLEIYPKRLQT